MGDATLPTSASAAIVSGSTAPADARARPKRWTTSLLCRYRRKPTEQLIDQDHALARVLRDAMLHDLAHAHQHTLRLGRMTASERVATFLLEMFERRDRTKALDLPMARNDIADYLGLTIETVCRTLSLFKRDGIIAIPNPHRIELLDRGALEVVGEA